MAHTPRQIRKLLIANRGEIAARIIAAARELDIETYAIYTKNDTGHTEFADHKIELGDPSWYMSIDDLSRLVKQYKIDAVHPGYGFLSESADFAERLSRENVLVVGPGAEILDQTGDKLRAKTLAQACDVPILEAVSQPTSDLTVIKKFVDGVGLPVIIKAVDGGGGRGIRLVQENNELAGLVQRAVEESPSRKVFVEKAAIQGYQHVEVQIVGDGRGGVTHLWERECSIQRRYQKIIEIAPSRTRDRKIVQPLIDAAVRMAKHINYTSLGTFEFLLNQDSGEFFFLEINPRLQVEHTITEQICGVDLVKAQLRLAQGANLEEVGVGPEEDFSRAIPKRCSIQLRITAEDPQKNFALSVGKIDRFHLPSGNGIRIETALISGQSTIISTQFDSLIAKLIITDRTWSDTIRKARRAISDVAISGVTTNLALLSAILWHSDFEDGAYNTRWLESKQAELIAEAQKWQMRSQRHNIGASLTPATPSMGGPSTSLFQKGDAWNIEISHPGAFPASTNHHLQLTRILRNEFPTGVQAEALITTAGQPSQPCTFKINSTNSSAAAASSQHRKGDRNDSTHVIIPFAGTLVEVAVDEGDVVREGDVICVVKQMKMELEVRAHRSGICSWVIEADDGEDLAENTLAAVIVQKDGSKM